MARGVERAERVSGRRIEREVRTAAAVGDELAGGGGAVQKALIGIPRFLKSAGAEIAAGSKDTLAVSISAVRDDVSVPSEEVCAEDTAQVDVAPIVQGAVAGVDAAASLDILDGRIVVARSIDSILRLEFRAGKFGVHDEIDHPGDRVGPVDGRRAARQHFHSLHQY